MPASGERLREDDLIDRAMCVQAIDWIFDLGEAEVSASQYKAREALRNERAAAKTEAALDECTETVIKRQYLCAMTSRKFFGALGCLTRPERPPANPVLTAIEDPWVEVETQHFLLWTDLPVTRAEALARRLEELRAAIVVTFFPDADPQHGRSRVIAVAKLNDWQRYGSGRSDVLGLAYSAAASPFHEALLLVSPGRGSVGGEEVVAHELVHHVTGAIAHDQPRWFAEGIASFFESVQLDPVAGEAFVGRIPPQIHETLEGKSVAQVEALVNEARARRPRDLSDSYAASYVVVAYLFSQQKQGIATYQQLLVQHGDASGNAFRTAFPKLTRETLARSATAWWMGGGHRPFRIKLPTPKPVSLAPRALPLADAYTARALLYLLRSGADGRANAELNAEAAVRADAHHVLGNLVLMFTRRTHPDPEIARAVLRAHSDDWMAWLMLVLALLETSAEAASARKEVCKRVPIIPR